MPSLRAFSFACALIACAFATLGSTCEPSSPPAPSPPASAAPPTPASAAPPAPVSVALPAPASAAPPAPDACDASVRPHLVTPDHFWEERWKLDAGAGDPSPAVATACKAILGRRAAAQAKLAGDSSVSWETLGRCLPSPKGAWAFDVAEVRTLPPDATQFGFYVSGWEVRLSLVYVTPAGQIVPTGKTGLVRRHGIQQIDTGVLASFDYDGDGVSELIVERVVSMADEDHDESVEVLTRKGDGVAPYAPAAGITVINVVDVDRDGRPDLIFNGPFRALGPCGLNGETLTGPLQVAHALPDGRLVIDDPVAREMVRAQCGDGPARSYLSTEDHLEIMQRITCARIFGVPAASVAKRLRAEYDRAAADEGGPGCLPLETLLALTHGKPTFTLPRCSR